MEGGFAQEEGPGTREQKGNYGERKVIDAVTDKYIRPYSYGL